MTWHGLHRERGMGAGRRGFLGWVFVMAWLGLGGIAGAAEPLDLVIRGGRVVDGTGNPAVHADVGIRDGRVVVVGRVQGEARRELDARGLVVAPGFIDVHTHADDLDELPQAENFVRMGVTTVIAGNCGSSSTDVAGWFRRLETNRISVNAGVLVGQGSVRSQVMGGSFARPATAGELEKMRGLVVQAMRDGALGMSTGLIYLPGTFTRTEELVELARAMAPFDGVYATHMRSEGLEIQAALEEAFRIGREAGVRVEISHLKLSGNAVWGRTAEVLGALEKARREGLDVTQDQYVYTASSTTLAQLVPEEYREGGRLAENLADPAKKEAMKEEMRRRLAANLRSNYAYAVVASHRARPELNGKNIVEAARVLRGADTLEDQLEVILEIVAKGGGSGVFHGMQEEDLREFARHPHTMFASDSGVRKFGEGVPHPRGYGNAARVLGRYVRELGVLRLEDAVRRLTTLPAATFRLADRGQLRPGAWADVVVLDPAAVTDPATYESPHQYATGFRWVLVNGEVVVEADRHTGARPGKAVRGR